jgi:hypothetical protein
LTPEAARVAAANPTPDRAISSATPTGIGVADELSLGRLGYQNVAAMAAGELRLIPF